MGNANSTSTGGQTSSNGSVTESSSSTSTSRRSRNASSSSSTSTTGPNNSQSPRNRTTALPPITSTSSTPTTSKSNAHASSSPNSSSTSTVTDGKDNNRIGRKLSIGRRRKSIELTDVHDPNLLLTSTTNNSSTRATSLARSIRRKNHSNNSDHHHHHHHHGHHHRTHGDIIITSVEDDIDQDYDEDDENNLGSGTLRGAMQGKAEHVVYGPRRPEPSVPNQVDITTKTTTTSSKPQSTTTSSSTSTKPQAISLPPSNFSTLSPTTIIDPDDTVHPGFASSPRLTSAVILSQDRMPVLVSPVSERAPIDSPLYSSNSTSASTAAGLRSASSQPPTPSSIRQPPRSLSEVLSGITSPSAITSSGLNETESLSSALPTVSNNQDANYGQSRHIAAAQLQIPTTSPPLPSSSLAPTDTVLAPKIPTHSLPISEADIPSGTPVIASPIVTPLPGNTPTGLVSSPAVLLPPRLFNAPVAAIPIPLLSVPSATIAASLLAAAVDLGAGKDGVPTLIKWKDEDGQQAAVRDPSNGLVVKQAQGPKEVFVTGTFAKGWQTKIELRKTDPSDFSALISLPPGPHRLKFIVDKEWKASKNLPVATDADGNLINYLQVNPADSKLATELWKASSGAPSGAPGGTSTTPTINPNVNQKQPGGVGQTSLWPGIFGEDEVDNLESFGAAALDAMDDTIWTSEIPYELIEYGEWESERDIIENSPEFLEAEKNGTTLPSIPPPPSSSGVPPPSLPAQLEKGPLNHAAYVTQGSGDDNSILPKPDHSVINHLAASPIKGGFLSVGVTTRYKRKFVTIVYYKALASRS